MPLYGGIDLHANNSVVVLLNEQDQVVSQKRLANHRGTSRSQRVQRVRKALRRWRNAG